MKLGVIEYMDCAHSLPGHPKCGMPHGHTYRVELVIEGQNRNGMIIDFDDLKSMLREVLSLYDHRSLDDFLEYSSVENVCEMIKSRIQERLSFPFSLKMWEGEGKWVES